MAKTPTEEQLREHRGERKHKRKQGLTPHQKRALRLAEQVRTSYVYTHRCPHDPSRIFYVGKGVGGRAWSIERHPEHAELLMQYAHSCGYGSWVRIEEQGMTNSEACELEAALYDRLIAAGAELFNFQRPVHHGGPTASLLRSLPRPTAASSRRKRACADQPTSPTR